jgi:hypothetical protein
MAVYHRTQRLQIYGEKPEVTQLFGGRYRMVVRCKAARDTEAWYNDNKDQIFASFGTLYSAQMSVDGIDPRVGEAYPDMCLVSNSASYTQTGEYVISFVYETLTAVWTKEQDDEVTSTDNGLRVLERSEVAKVDGFPIVQLSSPNSSKVVLSGMGNASNYFVLLVKANSANTIYWRATNEALATYNGSFTTANTDQWEYKVIYTPISIDQLEIGYDGTNYSTFYLSEFYLVSQSSNWQNNIVESFIKFEVTVNNPSPFTDTVVFTGSNGNTATGTNVQGGGTGSISSPYDEDDVGVATITDGGKTLYLESFQDQTGADNDAQVGRVVTRWAEPGILNTQREFARDGLLYVTFESQGTKFTPTALNPTYDLTDEDILAFQNGAAANLFRSRTRNVEGFKRYVVTVMLKQDGTPLTDDGTDNEVNSYQRYLPYQKPGTFTLAADSITASPGMARFALAQITELLSTSGNLAASYKPYSIANWANYNYSYVPSATGIAVVKNGGAKGYLGSGSFASSGGTVFGTDVDSAAGSAGSDPSPSAFNALNNQVMDSDNAPAFVTDEGVKWYRKMKVQMVGTMAANLGSV